MPHRVCSPLLISVPCLCVSPLCCKYFGGNPVRRLFPRNRAVRDGRSVEQLVNEPCAFPVLKVGGLRRCGFFLGRSTPPGKRRPVLPSARKVSRLLLRIFAEYFYSVFLRSTFTPQICGVIPSNISYREAWVWVLSLLPRITQTQPASSRPRSASYDRERQRPLSKTDVGVVDAGEFLAG